MATDSTSNANADDKISTLSELKAFTQKELDADTERHAQVVAASNGEVPQSSQTGATIDFSKKGIRLLPVEIIEMIAERVERLALSHNPQIQIPPQITLCGGLRYLNVRVNHLTEFPQTVLSLTKLEILDLSKNDITSIPEDIKRMSSLKFLAIVRNKITRLPLALGEMSNLHKLKFEDNPIEFPTKEELSLPEDKSLNGTADVDKDREICQQVKRVLKNKALRLRMMKPLPEEEASESAVETPKPPKRAVTGRFPVRPSVSGIEVDLTRSASNSPPDPAPLTARPYMQRSPSRNGLDHTPPTSAPMYVNGTELTRSQSQSGSTSASLRARRQGFLPDKRKNGLGAVTEVNSARSSNASTLKGAHAYNLSTSSTLSGIGSSSGAESSGGASPVAGGSGRRNSVMRRQLSNLVSPAHLHKNQAITAATRLRTCLYNLRAPLQQVAIDTFRGVAKRSTIERQVAHANTITAELDRLLATAYNKPEKEQDSAHKIVMTAQAALASYTTVMDLVKNQIMKIGSGLEPMHMRALMYQLYAAVVEARNVVTFLGIPTKASTEIKDTPRASRVSNSWSSRTVTPTESKPTVVNKRMRGATILRNQMSNASLRLVPPSRTETARAATVGSVYSATTPASADSFGSLPSAVLPSRSIQAMNQSSDETDDNEQLERIYVKLQTACDTASASLPQCLRELKSQMNASDNQNNSRAWSYAYKSCAKVLAANDQLASRVQTVKIRDPTLRNQQDFWLLCDNFVQSWTEFALNIKEIGSARLEGTNIRSLTKPIQRAVKDVSRTISDSSLYHQALQKPGRSRLAQPYPGLNTALAREMSLSVSNPPSATPSSANTVSVPATPLTAALGPAAQATIASTPGTAPAMTDYFTNMNQSQNTVRKLHDHPDTNIPPPQSSSAPQSAAALTPVSSYGQLNGMQYARR